MNIFELNEKRNKLSPISNFNPLDKVVELCERLLQAEKDKVNYLEKLLNK